MSMEETQAEVVNTTSVEAQTSANNTGVNRFAKHTGLFVDFDYLGIKIASPERILSWSYGEVKSSDTINYRTFKPERDGLFCARIFGPIKDYECLCGKYRRIKYKGIRCEKCDVEVTQSRIRRERMGHITLAYPALNILYLRSVPSKISILLDQTAKDIERVLYFEKYIVIDAGTSPLNKYETLSYEEYERAMNEYGQDAFKVGIGAKGLRSALESMNLQEEREKVARQLEVAKSEIKQTHIRRRLQLIEDFIQSGNRPEWMVFTVLPVLPPDLRPLVQLDGGKSAISDLNTLYARIINRNNRLKKLMEMNAPEIIIQNECRMLQDAVSSLLNNSSSNNAKVAKAQNGRPLKSISDNLKGKRGRLRQNLLGKRVDYSGRSVIVCGPELRLHECGVPKEMALELFKPFVLSKLRLYGKAITIRQGNAMIKARVPEVWEILEDVIKEHPVLLNRAPTLHRLGIQAFEPKLIETKAMQVHPLVCRAFNADFDGDQMAIHVPLSIEAQLEARILMMSSNNILSSANGTPMIVPRKDITVGLYYMTTAFDGEPGEKHAFYSQDDVMLALQNKEITINSKIKYYFKYEDAEDEAEANKMQCAEETTAGRIMLYSYLPHDGKIKFDYLNKQWSIGFLGDIVQTVYTTYGPKITVIFCDQIMYKGFLYSTLSGISFGKDDIKIPEDKPELIADVMQKINEIGEQYKEGYITNKERYNKVTDLWAECTDQLCDEVMVSLKENSNNRKINSIALMMNSGARASKAQMKQLAGMKGLIAKPNGAIIETAVTSNFKEGLSVMEFFNAAHGARKGNVDTALKTADAGYLTRRLVDVAQDCIITEDDCGSTEGVKYHAKVQDGKVITKLSEIIKGRFLAEDVVDGNGNVLIKANTLIGKEEVKILDENEVASATVRSPVTCKCKYGICSKCYGIDLATSQVVNVGEAVGVIAAQTIGEPGTQLTLNTFHIGGVATKDIAESVVDAQSAGTIRYADLKYVVDRDGDKIVISNSGHIEIVDANGKLLFSHFVGYSSKLFVEDGEKVKLGQRLAEWDPYNIYVIAEQDGIARLDDMIPGTSYQESVDEALGRTNKIIINWADTMKDLKPCVSVLGKDGKEIVDEHGISAKYYLSVGAITHVNDGDEIKVGDKIAKVLREDKSVVKDITGGLPRVEEIFEARAPKNSSIVAGADGYIEFGKTSRLWIEIKLHPDDKNIDDIVYKIPKGKYIAVRDGGRVRNGDIIMGGTLNPYDILRFQGISALTSYIVNEVQGVYKLQGIDIDSKHIEIIAKYMLNKVLIKDCGGTSLRNDYQYEISTVREENEKALEKGLAPAKYERLFYGITKSSLQTESFISAASFQETVKVLTDAAIKGKKDPLRGMKESIIIGRLIPAGTGFITRQLKQEANKISNVSNTSIDIDNL